MKYKLNFGKSFDTSLKFWLEKFLYHKLISLNSYKVKDRELFKVILQDMQTGGIQDIVNVTILCKEARRIGLSGINVYMNPLVKFYEYCQNLGFELMQDLNEDLLREFISVTTGLLKEASIKNYHTALLNFFSFIDKNNKLEENTSYHYGFTLAGAQKRFKQGLPTYLDEDEIKRFLDSLESYKAKHEIISIRNKLIIKLIIFSGARVSEILELESNNLFIQDEYYGLKLKGKGNKYRIVFVKASSIESNLKEWLLIKQSIINEKIKKLPYLFVTKKAELIRQNYIYSVVEKILLDAGIRKGKNGAHLLRHSFATLLYEKSKDLILVQESLGHANIETSRIYTHFNSDKLKSGADIISNMQNNADKF